MKVGIVWIVTVIAAVMAWFIAFGVNPILIPNDPYVAQRLLTNKSAGALFGMIFLTGFTLFFNYITKDDWFAKIAENPIACAIVIAALLYCGSWILTWS